MLRGKFQEAEAILRPLASHPHNTQLAAAAQALLDAARLKKPPSSEQPKLSEE